MKLSELKHNHSLTDLLKILLFSILMLAPIGMVASRCLYVIANKNAYQSYSGKENEYTQTPITSVNLNEIYHFSSEGQYTNTSTENTGYIGISEVSNVETNVQGIENSLNNAAFIRYYYSNSLKAIYYFDNNLTQLGSNGITTETLQFNFRLTSYTSTLTNLSMLSKLDISNESYIDNVFEYSIKKLEESNLFNWTQNTAIYSGVETMTTQLGITNQTIPILLVYWFLLTVIYVIIDIILKLFTYMTHALSSRKA